MSLDIHPITDFPTVDPLPMEIRMKAMLAVVQESRSKEEAATFLDMLGLPEPRPMRTHKKYDKRRKKIEE